MSNLDTRISNADQLLTTDVDKFCDVFADLYSNVCKPMLDIFIYVYQLTTTIGAKVSVDKLEVMLSFIKPSKFTITLYIGSINPRPLLQRVLLFIVFFRQFDVFLLCEVFGLLRFFCPLWISVRGLSYDACFCFV